MTFRKRVTYIFAVFLFSVIRLSYSHTIIATQTQDSIPKFDVEAFEASLKELSPRELAILFVREYRGDSLKSSISIKMIKDNMLASDDLKTQFWLNYSLTYWELIKHDSNKALFFTDKMYKIAKEIDDERFILIAIMAKGEIYCQIAAYKECLEYSLQALEIAKKKNNIHLQLAIANLIAAMKTETHDYAGAIELLEKTIVTFDRVVADKFIVPRLNLYVAFIKANIGIEDYQTAREYCEKTLVLSRKHNYNVSEFYVLSFLGIIECNHKNYTKAHEYLDQSLAILQKSKFMIHETPLVYLSKGKVFFGEKNYQKAIEIFLEAETLMKKYELKKEFLLEENYVLLAKAYNKIGDTQNSIKYYEKASETYKENDKRQGKVSADIIRKYDLATLKEELDISQKKSDQKSNLLTIATSSIGILLVSFIIFYKRRERQNKKKFEKLLANSESNHVEEKVPKVGAEKHAIPDAISSEILEKLKTFEAKEQYLKKNTTLAEVASKLKTNPKYLSKTVNKHKKKSFSNYIRDLRIQYVLHRLKHDKTFQSYTVQAIASEIGYKSSEAFSKAFKTETGLYPSYFIKQLQNTEKS